MNDDRELLELAAKAAGYSFVTFHGDDVTAWIGRDPLAWNPLTDDGDALRLAVQLQFDLSLGHRGASVKNWGGRIIAEELCHQDSGEELPCARRAIVRAAAEIGRSMP
jgi:hypothetical protein